MSLPRQQPPPRIRRKIAPLCKSFFYHHLDILGLSRTRFLALAHAPHFYESSSNLHNSRGTSRCFIELPSLSAYLCRLIYGSIVCGLVITADHRIQSLDFLLYIIWYETHCVGDMPLCQIWSQIYPPQYKCFVTSYIRSDLFFPVSYDLTSEAGCGFVATGFSHYNFA